MDQDNRRLTIDKFRKVRADRKVIAEGMTLGQLIRLGPPSKIVQLLWSSGGREHEFRVSEHGCLARVLPDRTGVAVLVSPRTELCILNADASVRLRIPGRFSFAGKTLSGDFAWFEEPRTPNAIATVIRTRARDFLVDFDPDNGEVRAISVTR